MRFDIQSWNSTEQPERYFDKKIEPKYIMTKFVKRPAKGLHVRKSGRTCDIIFDANLVLVGHYQCTVNLTEGEILQLAKLCRRNRSDEAFLKAIEAA